MTIHARFCQQVTKTPSGIAVVAECHFHTYAEVNALSNAVSRQLIQSGIHRGDIVGIAGARNQHIPAIVLGILKAGAAYVYFDPEWPSHRMAFVAQDARVKTIVASVADIGPLPHNADVIFINDVEQGGGAATEIHTGADDPAVIVYTSGSTGTPKGIAISHRAILARCDAGYEARPGDLQKSSLSVVAHISDLLLPLLAGHGARIISSSSIKDITRFSEVVEMAGTTRLVLVPSQLGALLHAGDNVIRKLRNVDTVILSGEAPTSTLVRECLRRLPRAALINAYGASEVCGLVAMAELRDPESITVGEPLPGSRVYILDSQQRPVAPGGAGEIYIAGAQLANGYVDNPERTAEAFFPDPLVDGDRMYRTGDRGQVNEAGQLVLLGRDDGEVHLNGHRIHVSEIESALEACAGVMRSVVVVDKSAEPYRLDAYIQYEGLPDIVRWREAVRARLPEYMVPDRWYPVRELPRLAGGKVDRHSLGTPTQAQAAKQLDNQHDVQSRVLDICRRELVNPDIDGTEHFLDCGGDSLLAVRVVLQIEEQFGVEVLFDELLDQPTLQDVAGLIARRIALMSMSESS